MRVPRSKHPHSNIRGIPVPKQPATIGGRLRLRRLQLRIHQSEAARRLKVSTVSLIRWECDRIFPSAEHHALLVEYLGHDPFTNRPE